LLSRAVSTPENGVLYGTVQVKKSAIDDLRVCSEKSPLTEERNVQTSTTGITMAVRTRTETLAIGETRTLHTTVATRFSVEILEGRDLVRLQRVIFGAAGGPFLDENFLFVRRGEAIPFGRIRATPRAAESVRIRYRVRSGRDFTGVPEIREG
jgi:hypothetical protein